MKSRANNGNGKNRHTRTPKKVSNIKRAKPLTKRAHKNGNGKNGHTTTTQRDSLISSVIPPIGQNTMMEAQEVMQQTLPRIAEGQGKKEKELTPYDVMVFTYTKLPHTIGMALFDVTLQQFKQWQSMVGFFPQYVPFTRANDK